MLIFVTCAIGQALEFVLVHMLGHSVTELFNESYTSIPCHVVYHVPVFTVVLAVEVPNIFE